MKEPHKELEAMLRKRYQELDKEMRALQGDLRAHAETIRLEGTDDEYHLSNALGIANTVFDMKGDIDGWFTTWIGDE